MLRLSPSMLLRQASSSRGRNFLAGIGFLALSSLTAYACPPVQATVRSGQQSVKGAFVVLFAAGSGGYGSSPTVLDLGYTDANGNVKLLKNYTCPGAPRDQLYLVAEGGTFGVGYNHNRSLMAGLGTCGSWGPGTSVVINEVSTIAAAFALSPFTSEAAKVGTSAANYHGLANAFETINNLVNGATGTARTVTPAYSALQLPSLNSSTVPQSRIDTLADILVPCVESSEMGSTTAACTTLFQAATPPGGVAPINTLQAALNIAQNPGNNVAALYAISSSAAPYQPSLTVAPTDWQLAISYTGAGLGLAPNSTVGDIVNSSLAIDAADNIWVTAYGQQGGDVVPNSSMIAEFNHLGAPLTPSTTQPTPTTVTYGGYLTTPLKVIEPIAVAIEEWGNVWFSGASGYIDAITQNLAPYLPAPIQTGPLGPVTFFAIDKSGNVFTAGNPGSAAIAEYSSNGALLSPAAGDTGGGSYGNDYYGTLNDLTFDSTGSNLWSSDNSYGDFYRTSAATGQLVYDYYPTGGQVTSLVAGAAGNIYGCPTGPSTIDVFNASSDSAIASYPTTTGRGCGAQMVIDGLGNVWVLDEVLDEYSSTGQLISPPSGYTATSSDEAPTFGLGVRFAADGSGNLWILNQSTGNDSSRPYNALVQVVGAAAPVVTPISLALAEGKIAKRP